MIYRKLLYVLLILLSIFLSSKAFAEFCCDRDALFPPIVMPPEQAYDCTNSPRANHYSALREGNFFTCPIYWGEYSWGGRKLLAWMVDEIGRTAGAVTDPEAKAQMEKMLDADYIFEFPTRP